MLSNIIGGSWSYLSGFKAFFLLNILEIFPHKAKHIIHAKLDLTHARWNQTLENFEKLKILIRVKGPLMAIFVSYHVVTHL